jgi:hypothetical protein
MSLPLALLLLSIKLKRDSSCLKSQKSDEPNAMKSAGVISLTRLFVMFILA